jgi:thiamine-phosphate pyrophosphorylase
MGMQTDPSRLWGLYAITPDGLSTPSLLEKSQQILLGGARILQYRNKQANDTLKEQQAHALRLLTHEHEALLIINDNPVLAAKCKADGIHLGKNDGSIAEARKVFPSGLVGVSCYDSLDRARQAFLDGADHIAFGSMAASSTKPDACQAPLSLLHEAKIFGLPLVAIGGITLRNAPNIVQAGADALAVISALFDDPQPFNTAKQFTALFERKKS